MTGLNDAEQVALMESASSMGHPTSCKPCAFFCFGVGGCRRELQCSFCHLEHKSKRQEKRQTWKEQKHERKITSRLTKEMGGLAPQLLQSPVQEGPGPPGAQFMVPTPSNDSGGSYVESHAEHWLQTLESQGPAASASALPADKSEWNDDFSEFVTNLSIEGNPVSVSIGNPHLPDCPITGISSGFTELSGYTSEDILGRNCRLLSEGCDVEPSIRAKMRYSVKTGFESVVTVPNQRKNGVLFQNMVYMSAFRVGSRNYIVSIQADDISKAGVQISTMPHYGRQLQAIIDRIFGMHVEKWAEKQLQSFCANLPQAETWRMMKTEWPDCHGRNKRTYVYQELNANDNRSVFCKNTFLDIDENEDEAETFWSLPRCSSDPAILQARASINEASSFAVAGRNERNKPSGILEK